MLTVLRCFFMSAGGEVSFDCGARLRDDNRTAEVEIPSQREASAFDVTWNMLHSALVFQRQQQPLRQAGSGEENTHSHTGLLFCGKLDRFGV